MAAFFGGLGKAIEIEDLSEFDAMSVATATFATYFKYVETIHQWLKDHGVAEQKARDYVTSLFKALAAAPETMPDSGFTHLAVEYATRGGINEQVLRELTTRNMFEVFAKSLDDVHSAHPASSAASASCKLDCPTRSSRSRRGSRSSSWRRGNRLCAAHPSRRSSTISSENSVTCPQSSQIAKAIRPCWWSCGCAQATKALRLSSRCTSPNACSFSSAR